MRNLVACDNATVAFAQSIMLVAQTQSTLTTAVAIGVQYAPTFLLGSLLDG